ncbi:CsgG/HfaB family protein [Pseudorhodobacter sp. W20_MBD10_FR17]|uniref:CsgG/HfaB family protein n=1 Tax=Pseudorhodobacter sp. W20_MBD10_FR17 TaxID=3240266 RepID=UPI003F9BA2CF
MDDGFRLGFMPSTQNIELPKGPPIEDLVTPFDTALSCMQGKLEPSISFAVGQVVDATGKETYADGGSGKFVTQGAGEMVQSALFRAGVTVVNRRDPNIAIVEQNWGIRDLKQQTPANFYVSGSINSLDFIPGGGVAVDVAGMGTRAKQSRILIALDLSMTDAFSGRIVGNVSLQKQIFTREVGSATDRFFGQTLLSLEAGGMEREAVHFAMRQLLNFSTMELLGQLMARETYEECRSLVSPLDGNTRRPSGGLNFEKDQNEAAIAALKLAKTRNIKEPMQALQQPAAPNAKTQAQRGPVPQKALELAARATTYAGRAINAAEVATNAKTFDEASSAAAEATQFLAVSAASLKLASQNGLYGPEGDGAAMLVQQAMLAVQQAQQSAMRLKAKDEAKPEVDTAPVTTAPRNQIPGTKESQTDQLIP